MLSSFENSNSNSHQDNSANQWNWNQMNAPPVGYGPPMGPPSIMGPPPHGMGPPGPYPPSLMMGPPGPYGPGGKEPFICCLCVQVLRRFRVCVVCFCGLCSPQKVRLPHLRVQRSNRSLRRSSIPVRLQNSSLARLRNVHGFETKIHTILVLCVQDPHLLECTAQDPARYRDPCVDHHPTEVHPEVRGEVVTETGADQTRRVSKFSFILWCVPFLDCVRYTGGACLPKECEREKKCQ